MPKFTLRGLRANFGLSSKDVAKEIGIHQQTLLKYEQDSSRIPMDLLEKLSNYYQIDKNDIFLGKKYELKRNFVNH